MSRRSKRTAKGNAAPRGRLPRHLEFAAIASAALPYLPAWAAAWAPNGVREGNEYVALNPRRADRHLGSFRINLRTGAWADFAIAGAKGGDAISLCAYLHGITRLEAARLMACALGMEDGHE